jgi:hypothetical protein
MDKEKLEKLTNKLQTGNVLSRRSAAQKLAQSGDPLAVMALTKACSDPDQIVQMNAIRGLSAIGTPDAVGFLKGRGIEVVAGQPQYTGAAAAENAQRMMKSARVNMGVGAALLIAGAAITFFTYQQASREGGSYYVTWGLMVIGAVDIAMGVYQYIKAKKELA